MKKENKPSHIKSINPYQHMNAILLAVLENGQSLSEALKTTNDPKNKALIQAVTYGVCRFYFTLDHWLMQLLEKPLKKKDADIRMFLLIGLYQLGFMRIKEHAAVNETVSAVKNTKKSWAANFANAILRRFLREKEHIMAAALKNIAAKHAHPKWLIEMIKTAWPDRFETILAENNQQAPMTLRVNLTKTSREDYLQQLAAVNLGAESLPQVKTAIVLNEACDVSQLPGFADGVVSVQDAAAQLAAGFLDLSAGQRVLDACSAPGGKALHILETEPNIESLLAIDQDPVRLQKITENLTRSGLSAKLICADAADVASWWDGVLFDRILLDAPCSAIGVCRRHPDIKLLRRVEDISVLAELQLKLLQALWPLLKPQGILLYATCSILPAENDEVIAAFCKLHDDVEVVDIMCDAGEKTASGLQIFPGIATMDGFYYAKLRKNLKSQ